MSSTLYILTFDGRPLMASRDLNELKAHGITRAEAFYPPNSSPDWTTGPVYGWSLTLGRIGQPQQATPLRIASVGFSDATGSEA